MLVILSLRAEIGGLHSETRLDKIMQSRLAGTHGKTVFTKTAALTAGGLVWSSSGSDCRLLTCLPHRLSKSSV